MVLLFNCILFIIIWIIGYLTGVRDSNNEWIWASNAPNLRQFCRGRSYSVKDEGKDNGEAQLCACYKGRKK